jgi:hypothetical protein
MGDLKTDSITKRRDTGSAIVTRQSRSAVKALSAADQVGIIWEIQPILVGKEVI